MFHHFNKVLVIALFIIMVLWSIDCTANPWWNRYHQTPLVYNFEGQNIVLDDLPSLPLDTLKHIDVRSINPWLFNAVLGKSSSSFLDSILRCVIEGPLHDELSIRSSNPDDYWRFGWISNGRVVYDETVRNPEYEVYDRCLNIYGGVDSYLIRAETYNCKPFLLLLNLINGALQSVMLVSIDNSYEGKSVLFAEIIDGQIDLFENSYCSLINCKRYISDQVYHIKSMSLNETGQLLDAKNYCLFFSSSGISNRFVTNPQSDVVEYENYVNENIILPDLPECLCSVDSTIDIKAVSSTPLSSFTEIETVTIGPVLCHDNWTGNDFYWLNMVKCRDGVTSYLVLTVGLNLYKGARIFMINVKDNHITSVVCVSSIECFRDLQPYKRSCFSDGIITISNDYGEEAFSPIRVLRDCSDNCKGVVGDAFPSDIDEKYDVIHDFNLYESNMPKSSKYVLKLDKDGFVTRL